MTKRIFVCCLIFSVHICSENVELMLNPSEAPRTLTFFDTLKLSLQYNYDFKKTEAELRIAEGEATLSLSKILPEINAELSHQSPPRSPIKNADGQALLGLEAKVSLLDAKSLVSLKAKRENVEAAKLKLLAKKNQLFYDVGTHYIDALIADAHMKNAQEEQEQFRKQAEILRRKSLIGNARMLDLRRAQYLAAKAESDYLLKRQDFLQKLGALGAAIGVEDYFLLSDVNIDSPYFSQNSDSLLTLALLAPDIGAAVKDVSSAGFNVVSDGFDFMPKIFASIETGWLISTTGPRILAADKEFSLRTMFTLQIPLFSGGSTLSSMKISKARKTMAEINLRMKQNNKRLNLNSVLTEMGSLLVVKTNAEIALDAARLALESAQRMFNNNEATGLELAEAQTNHFTAKNLLANGRLNLVRARLKLLLTIGKLSEIL